MSKDSIENTFCKIIGFLICCNCEEETSAKWKKALGSRAIRDMGRLG